MSEEIRTNQVRKLPLWKSCLQKMEEEGLHYGTSFTVEWLEEQLSAKFGTIGFMIAIHDLRIELEKRGFAIAGSPKKTGRYAILPAKDNAAVMSRMSRKGKRYFVRTVLLGSNTDMSELTPEEKKRHQSVLERARLRVALIDREKTLKRFLAKHAPRLLGSEPSR